jgi:glycosyltransferase involved in cell wall biosynthesis
MSVVFMIGTNDVGGAEYVSFQHVLMAHKNKLDMVVLSGTTGKFYDLMVAAGVKVEVIGLTPAPGLIELFIKPGDVVFNCNFFGILPVMENLKKKIGFVQLVILHNDTNWVYNNVVKKYDSSIDLYYSIHQKIVDAFISKGYVSVHKFIVIPNCVDWDLINSGIGKTRAELRQQLGYATNHFVIGMVTRVAGDKNILDALRILNRLPSFMEPRLIIVGGAAANEGSERYFHLVKEAIKRDPGLRSRVTITGNQEMKDVYSYMKVFDLGLNCSPSEGLPIALLEMMAAGIPCVMPSIGDIPLELTGRGVVVPIRQRMEISEIFCNPCYTQKEIALFVDAINLIYKKKTERLQYGEIAREYIRQHRSLSVQEKQFLKFLDMGESKNKRLNEPVNLEETAEDPKTLPSVSVLMPTRDGNPEWMKQAIESIFAQDYKGEMELVIVNHDCRLSMTELIDGFVVANVDFTRPGTKQISHRVMRQIKVADPNVTFSEILDIGVNACKGEIIVRMDHDDIADSRLVSKVVRFLKDHEDIPVVGVQILMFDGQQNVTSHPVLVTKSVAFKSRGYWFVNHPGIAMRKETLLKIGGYGKVKNGYAEDYTLWCKYLKEGYTIANLPDVLMNYRVYNKRTRPDDFMKHLEEQKSQLK